MKRYIKYLFIIALGFVAAGCQEENPTDGEILNNRPVSKLEVSYAQGDVPVTALSFTHNAIRKELQVVVNNENLKWNLESNRDWCVVVPEEHKGTGVVTLDIAANESFEDREQATLTFVAGEYRGFRINVDQTCSAFIIGQPYFVSPIGGGAVSSNITTVTGTSWEFTAPDWITVSKGASSDAAGYTSTALSITPKANTSASRYGMIELSSGAEKDYIYVYQFGDDLQYDASGNIYFPSGTPAVLTFTAPSFMVKDIQTPDFATGEVKENEDGTSTITITMEDNLSDCGDVREVNVSLSLSNASASIVNIPKMIQDYVPAYGLVTGKGLAAFAAAVSAGTSTADWEQDGVVRVIQDIDMNGVTGWEGIGTSDKPFTGTFDGGGHAVTNLKNTASGLFNYCKNATVKDISLGKGSSIYNNKPYSSKGCFGGIVSQAESTTIDNCSLEGSVEFAGTSEGDAPAFVGGIVGWADNKSVVKAARMNGKLQISTPSATDVVCNIGGIAGLCEGSLTASEVLGQVTFASGIGTANIGGIEGSLVEGATVGNNSFMGTITLGGNCAAPIIGGLYGTVATDHNFDFASDKSVSLGNIVLNTFYSDANTIVYAGGFVGFAAQEITLSFKGFEAQTNIQLDYATTAMNAKSIRLGGYLGGCPEIAAVSGLNFDSVQSAASITVKYATTITCPVRRAWFGGIVGYVNGPATFKSCTNSGDVGKYEGGVYCARSNGYGEIIGGIVGYAHGGNVTIEGCLNHGEISNSLYNNNGVTGTWSNMYTPPVSGGIIGAFNYGTTVESGNTLTIKSCSNIKNIFSYRGYTGGIVGFCYNATITGCSNQGLLANGTSDQCAYRGGIAAAAGNATISDCTVNCNITAMVYGSADYGCAGGILGIAREGHPVKITNCSYYGIIKASKQSTTKPEYPGGILGLGTEDTKISGCQYGGNVQGVEISENNVATAKNVIGNETGSISEITYWNGKI